MEPTLFTLFKSFFRLGLLGFGGPVALVALMESEVCRSRRWLNAEEFSERFVICKLLPGPVAFQMALWIGHKLRGVLGGLIAGLAFLMPGAFLVLLLAIFYQEVGHLNFVAVLTSGMRIGALVVIWDSAVRLFEPYFKIQAAWMFLATGLVLYLCFPSLEPLIILVNGSLAIALRRWTRLSLSWVTVLASLFWVHFKAGAFTFGTGLAIIPILQHAVVDVYLWMSAPEFLDAVAFGQITPGPVTLTSTFVGYRAAGFLGALAATLGMYLPGVIVILIIMPIVFPKLQGARTLIQFGMGAIPTVIGCIIGAAFGLVQTTLVDTPSLFLCFTLLILNTRFRLVGWKIILLSTLLYGTIDLFK